MVMMMTSWFERALFASLTNSDIAWLASDIDINWELLEKAVLALGKTALPAPVICDD
jgi:hypothetical protein